MKLFTISNNSFLSEENIPQRINSHIKPSAYSNDNPT